MNFQTRTLPTGGDLASSAPPSPAELAEKFPQFEILECLGRGGMGIVYKARQKALDRIVAIKILAGEWQDAPGFAERFEKEAKLLAKLNHPNIVTIHDFGNAGGLFHIVMEFIDGVNVRDLLRDGKMPAEQALAIVPPICDALQFAHDHGIVHRDIKPENILLDREGRVKIADFGIATLAGDAADRSGTPAYMAPEQEVHAARIDHRADIFALGVVLYEMLTGERPTTSPVAPSKRVRIDVRLDEVVLRALENTPELRFQSAVEFHTVLE
jgi:serine/threonine protein kinase